MHLKSLTLKGFKSFASATTLRFEPGITCVVGPNGSGKSNVVDALTWVMGEQGAKALRGGKMQDVIFAGTAGRAPLGRAEVTLTIDNSDGALPIEYSEVSITRRMFRDGAGEYEINGNSCRLMDVQELLSDSGIGREMHVIVGQGRLSAILESRPEDRRAFIEEAAGVLKHRKRKEKAVRKLDAMQANLARLTDLTAELRRQLKPLGRQAEVARRAQTVQADLRDARLRLAADDLVTRRAELAHQTHDEKLAREQQETVQAALEAATAELGGHEQALARLTPQAEAASQTWFQLSALAERVSATIRIAQERARHLDSELEPGRGQDPDEMEARAERIAAEEAELIAAVDIARATLEAAREQLAEREEASAEAERAHFAAVRAIADRREGLARLAGQVDTLRTRAESVDAEVARLDVAIGETRERGDAAQREFDAVEATVDDLDAGELGLDGHHERAVEALDLITARVAELQAAERDAGQEVASLRARIDALSMGLERKDGGAWLLEHHTDRGLTGPVAELIRVDPGYEAAVAAVMGPAADAIAAESAAAAAAAVQALRAADGGRAAILHTAEHSDVAPRPDLPGSATWIADNVHCPESLRTAVDALLDRVAVVDSLDAATELVCRQPSLRAVTRDGDLVGTGWVTGGSDRRPSTLEVQAAIDASTSALEAAERRSEELAAASPARSPSRPIAPRSRSRRWPLCTSPTPTCPRSTSSWGAWGTLSGRPTPSRSGCSRSGPRRRAGGRRRSLRSPNSRSGCAARRTNSPVPRPTRAVLRRRISNGRPPRLRSPRYVPWRSKPGSRCAPPRSERNPFGARLIRCVVRPRPNARPERGPSGRGRPVEPPPRWRPQWPRPGRRWPTVSTASWRTRWHTVTS